MKIRRFDMEDWLNDHASVALNLAESGVADERLGDYLALCGSSVAELEGLWLGNNDTRGSERLRRAIAGCYQRVDAEDVLAANGTSEVLFALFNELLEPGDEVVVPVPAFQCLFEVPAAIGCQVRPLNLLESDRWRLDLERLDALVTEGTRLVVINTPHNPVGWTLSEAELRQIGELTAERGVALLFDEHYRFLPLELGTALTRSGYDVCAPINPRCYATGSMIKCFGIVGLRIGWLLGDAEMRRRCRDYKDYLTHTIPLVTDRLAALGLEERDRIIAAKKEHILPNLASLEAFMAEHDEVFDFVTPTGGVVCFPRVRPSFALSATELCRRLIQRQGVSLLPGFGFGVEDHLRLNFGVPREPFIEALDRIDRELR